MLALLLLLLVVGDKRKLAIFYQTTKQNRSSKIEIGKKNSLIRLINEQGGGNVLKDKNQKIFSNSLILVTPSSALRSKCIYKAAIF